MAASDIETLREILKDNTVHIAVGIITKMEYAEDRSVLRCEVNVFPEMRPIVARMSWEAVGPDSGILMPPQAEDMVLIAIADSEEDQAFIIKRLTSKVDKIPVQVTDGHLFLRPVNGKKAYLSSDTKVILSKGGEADPTENVPLGQQLKSMMQELLTEIKSHVHMSSVPGAPTTKPLNEAAFEVIKSGKVDNEAILSKLSFTE